MKSVVGVALATVFVLTTAVSAAGPDFVSLGFQPYDPPKPAPPFALPDVDGKTTRLEDFRGKVLLLFYWATW